jgi:hypothetical protein
MAKLDDLQKYVQYLLTNPALRKRAAQAPYESIKSAAAFSDSELQQLELRAPQLGLAFFNADFAINTWIAGTTAYCGGVELCPLDYIAAEVSSLPPMLSVEWNPGNDAMRTLGFWRQLGPTSTAGVKTILEDLAGRLAAGNADEKNAAKALRSLLRENF